MKLSSLARIRLPEISGPLKAARRAEIARKADRSARLDALFRVPPAVPRGSDFPSDVENKGEIGFVCTVFSRRRRLLAGL
jgi:hypothetical protein